MKIGLSTANYFPEMNTEDMIDHYGALGIDSVEIFLNTYSEMEEGFIAMLRDRCDRYGITVNSVHVMSMIMEPCLFDLLPRRRQDFEAVPEYPPVCPRAGERHLYLSRSSAQYGGSPILRSSGRLL